jgi:hypothetical protein
MIIRLLEANAVVQCIYMHMHIYAYAYACIYESPEDGHRSGPKHVVEVIHIKLQILLRTEVCKKCLIGTRATGCITQKLRL